METLTHTITREIIDEALDYKSYNRLISNKLEQGRTTNEDNRQNMLDYTKLNIHRTSRWDKRAKIEPKLAEKIRDISFKMTWFVITEGWCGDSAQVVPFLNKMAELSPNLDLKMILRDEHPEIMDQFLTNGSRSIPKLVALDSETLEVLGTWGPRPQEIQKIYMAERANLEIENDKATQNLHLWYAKNKGKAIQSEFSRLLDEWSR